MWVRILVNVFVWFFKRLLVGLHELFIQYFKKYLQPQKHVASFFTTISTDIYFLGKSKGSHSIQDKKMICRLKSNINNQYKITISNIKSIISPTFAYVATPYEFDVWPTQRIEVMLIILHNNIFKNMACCNYKD